MALKWCDKHEALFRENGAPMERIHELVTKALSGLWANRPGLPKTKSEIDLLLENLNAKKPICCRLGDDKLKRILVGVSTDVERMKEKYVDDGQN